MEGGSSQHTTSSEKSKADEISAMDREHRYGWRNFRPDCLQFLNNSKWLLFMICLANFSQSMATNGFVGTILSTLETRFGLKSTQSALIASAYEIGTVPALVVVSMIGNRINRTLWLGLGILMCSIGSFMFVIPHYATDLYRYERGPVQPLCGANVTDCGLTSGDGEEPLGRLIYILIVGNILHGIGTTPLYTVGVAYMDAMITTEMSALYLGLFYSMGVLGPAVGYIGGGFLLDLFTDFDSPEALSDLTITNQDPRWVGAWWPGFWLNVVIMLVVTVPLMGFPKDMPGAAAIRATRESEAHGDSEAMTSRPDFGTKWKDIWTILVSLAKNWPFVFLTLLSISEAMIVQGFTAFGPKFLENQFVISSTMGAILFGAITVPGGAGGTILGGYIIKRFKLDYSKIMKLNLIMHVVVAALLFEFVLHCPTIPYAGVNAGYNGTFQSTPALGEISLKSNPYKLADQCNDGCNCSDTMFEPVCGQNDLMYYSPCYAGCQQFTLGDETKNYFNCSCIPNVNVTIPAATAAVCETDCILLPVFLTIFFISMCGTFFGSICAVNATLRTIPKSQLANGIAIQWIFLRLIASVPAPLIFGAVLDATCILWDVKCDKNSDSACLLYNSETMGLNMMLICGVLKAVTLVSTVLAWRLHRPPSVSHQDDLDIVDSEGSNPSEVSASTSM